jgi:type I restriction enzyme, S subunit
VSDELPKEWINSTVGECFLDIRNGTTATQNKNGKGLPVTRIETIQNNEFDLSRIHHIENLNLDKIEAFSYQPGDIAFSHINSYEHVGKTALYKGEPEILIHGMNLLRLRLGHGQIEPSYVHLFMQSQFFREEIRQRVGHAVNQVSINQKNLTEVPFIIAPLNEQQRIVAKLEALLGKVDACQTRLERIPALLKRFRQSVLAAACSGRLTIDWREKATPEQLTPPDPVNIKGINEVEEIFDVAAYWRWIPLQALCDPDRAICYGVIKLGATVQNGIPCLRTSDVKPLIIDTTDVKRIALDISDQYRRTLLRGGEVLVNVRGTLGGVAVVPEELRDWNISREVAVVPVLGVIPKFIALWIASLPCQNWLTGIAKGVAYTGINIKDLRLFPVSLPSIFEQQEIVRRVEALFKHADRIEERYTKAKAYIDKLTQSILAKAFRGELVPQDPNDEPASVLLKRIKEERGKIRQKPKIKRAQKKN